MPVKIFRNEKFATPHENIIFDEMINELKKQWSNSTDLIIMLGNVYSNGSQIDAMLIKKDSISVIDFKNYGGEIKFSENSNWTANGVEIKMDGKINPYLQILNAKFEIIDKLNKNLIFKKGNEVNLGHISGIVLFHQPIIFNRYALPPKIASWFHVTDIFNSLKLIYNLTSSRIKLSENEILKFADLFDLEEYEFSRPKIAIEEEKFIDRELLFNELLKLEDIFKSIEIAKGGGEKLIETHDNFIKYYYPVHKPENSLIYHLTHYHDRYENKRNEFIEKHHENTNSKIDLIYNINSKNGYILNEYIHDTDLKEYLTTRVNTRKLIVKFSKSYNLNRVSGNLSISSYAGYFNLFYGRGIFVEQPFMLLRTEIQERGKLINLLHALYYILKNWFGSEMILQHKIDSKIWCSEVEEILNLKTGLYVGLFDEPEDYPPEDLERKIVHEQKEKFISIEEYKYARGISERWYSKMMSQFNESEEIDYYKDITYTLFIDGEEKEKSPIARVKLPQKLISIFHELYIDITKIISEDEFNDLLDMMRLSWIEKEWIDIRDIHLIDLKTHLLYSNLLDIDFLIKETQANERCCEPFYLTCLEQIGEWGWHDFATVSEIFAKSYKILEKYSIMIPELPTCLSIIPSYKLDDYPKGEYPFSRENKISLEMVGNQCQVSVVELISFLSSLNVKFQNKLWRDDPGTILANREYKMLLKKFKTSAVNYTENQKPIKNLSVTDMPKIVGYDDIKKYIKKSLESYKNPEQAVKFGLKKTAGIILYGPPGCGKTYWASQIALDLQLKFEEIPRSTFGSSYVDGAMKGLEDKLNEIEKKSPVVIFFDEFDSIGTARNSDSVASEENRKVVNTLLQRIPKLIEKGNVIIAATNFINDLDSALIRPGRFDLHIPILLPLPEERADLILQNLTLGAPETLLLILSNNLANQKDYWMEYTESMYLFSNSHVIDFCNELRGFLYEQSATSDIADILILEENIFELINRVKSKIRENDVKLLTKFYNESSNLMNLFKDRMQRLRFEIDKFDNSQGKKHKPVGYKTPE